MDSNGVKGLSFCLVWLILNGQTRRSYEHYLSSSENKTSKKTQA